MNKDNFPVKHNPSPAIRIINKISSGNITAAKKIARDQIFIDESGNKKVISNKHTKKIKNKFLFIGFFIIPLIITIFFLFYLLKIENSSPSDFLKWQASTAPNDLELVLDDENISLDLSSMLFFYKEQAVLTPQAKLKIKELSRLIDTRNDVFIKGHTDSDGEQGFNYYLSEQRAKAVYSALHDTGISSDSKITLIAHGENMPIDTNDTEEGKEKNRRVEIIIKAREVSFKKKIMTFIQTNIIFTLLSIISALITLLGVLWPFIEKLFIRALDRW